MKVFILLIVALAGVQCQEAQDFDGRPFPVNGTGAILNTGNSFTGETKIIGGGFVEAGQYPNICALQRKFGDLWYFRCSTIILDENNLITTATCVDSDTSYRVICGEHDLLSHDETEQLRHIEYIRKHEAFQYNGTLGFPNNIAILKPSEPLVFNSTVRPLPLAQSLVNVTRDCTVTGWGVTETGRLSPILRDLDIRRITHRICRFTWRGDRISFRHLCFGDYTDFDSTTCFGDGGSPAFCDGQVVGMASWLSSKCYTFTPSVYTRLDRYQRWIKRNRF